jgi:S-DNA-T family DNA segregation ATPase FtsK/SpoIIIE
MKGGLEFQLFENRKRITVVSDHKSAKEKISTLDQTLGQRFALLKENQCKDIEAFTALDPNKIKISASTPGNISKVMNHLLVVIDEAAELFLSSSRSTISDTQDITRKVIRLAAQGRAVGIHLVIATQKPDSNAINTQIKANLTGILSFPMSTLGASMSILGNGRAKELPNIPGRAIWKNGLDQFEVQTPYISSEQVKIELDKISPVKNEENI